MPRAAPLASAFNAGELSPRMAGRVSSDVYASGCYRMENFIPDIAGPAVKRAGTAYVSGVKDSADRTWLVRFEFSISDCMLLEFGDGYIRFFKNRDVLRVSGVAAYNGATAYIVGDLVSNAGVNYYCKADVTGTAPPNATYWHPLTSDIYEIPTPYALADLTTGEGSFALDFVQSADVIYLALRGYKPRKLSRFGNTEWTLTEYAPEGGPFKDVNITATTVYASAATGTITLNASTSIFTAAHVGSMFYVEQKTVNDVLQWEAAKSITAGDVRRSDGRNYEAVNTATTGTVKPTHTEGAVYDGDSGVQWTYLDPGYGWAQITGYTSGTQVSATVLSRIPAGAVSGSNVTTKWAFGAWSSSDGYPERVLFYLDRLVWMRDQQVWMTVAGDYENMRARDHGLQLTDSAIALTVPSRRGGRILWAETLEVGLFVGTGSDEWLIGPASRNEPLGPLNVSASAVGAIGSKDVQALRLFDSIIFSQRSGRKLRAVRYLQGDGALYGELNAFADHVLPGVVSYAYVGEPYSLIFAASDDGTLAAVTYYPEQNVLGWFRLPMNGVVECVNSMPAPDGKSDDLWLIVRRTIDGNTVRYVEFMRAPLDDDDEQADAFYVDSGITYDGAATTTITGLGHLEGETVNVATDGAKHPQRTVASGSITLQRSSAKVHVGLPYTATIATMDIEAGSANGTSQGKLKRAYSISVRLLRTLGGKAGTSETKLDALQFRSASMAMNEAPPLFTGDKIIAGPGGSERQSRIWFVHDEPLPATVVAMMPRLNTEDA